MAEKSQGRSARLTTGMALLVAWGVGACDADRSTPTEVQLQGEETAGALEPTAHPPGHFAACPATLPLLEGGVPAMVASSVVTDLTCDTTLHNGRHTMVVDGTLPEEMRPDHNTRITGDSGLLCDVFDPPPGWQGGEPVPFTGTDNFSVHLHPSGRLSARCVLIVD